MRFGRFILSGLLLLLACGKISSVSETKGALNQVPQTCFDYPESRYEELEAALQGVTLFKNFQPEEKAALLKHFYAVPPLYRDVLIRRAKEGSFEGFTKETMDEAGHCWFDDESCIRILLSNTIPDVIEFSMIHEVGHGVQRVAARKLGKSYEELETLLKDLIEEGKTHNAGPGQARELRIRDYSLTDPKEYFSDSFHNYYCSPKSHDFVKTYLPKDYAFLQSALEPPMWIKEPRYLNPVGAVYMEDLMTLFNEASKTCDLVASDLSLQDETGLFEVQIAVKGQENKKVKLILNYNVPLATQLSKLRRNIQGYIPSCPIE